MENLKHGHARKESAESYRVFVNLNLGDYRSVQSSQLKDPT
jgi:hypothetical protein